MSLISCEKRNICVYPLLLVANINCHSRNTCTEALDSPLNFHAKPIMAASSILAINHNLIFLIRILCCEIHRQLLAFAACDKYWEQLCMVRQHLLKNLKTVSLYHFLISYFTNTSYSVTVGIHKV